MTGIQIVLLILTILFAVLAFIREPKLVFGAMAVVFAVLLFTVGGAAL